MKLTLTISSLVTLALLLVAAARENYFAEWRAHQRQYKTILVSKARDEAERGAARALPMEIRQVVAADLGRIDRCVSCHLGLDDPRLKDVPQPYTAHPGDLLERHDVDKIGCTICHGGQGLATTKLEAHANRGEVYWERPLLPAPFVQSSCGVCHDRAALEERGAPALARGLELFHSEGCMGCHKIDEPGGVLGPSLERVGDKGKHGLPFAHVNGERTAWNWHREHLRDPQRVVPGSKMSKIGLDREKVDAIVTYLLSLQTINLTERMTPRDKYEEKHRLFNPPAAAGAELYRRFCAACHGDGAETVFLKTLQTAIPSIRNPDFLAIASDQFLFRSIRDGRAGTSMPAWGGHGGGLTDSEIRGLVAYLVEARTEGHTFFFEPGKSPSSVNGKDLYEKNCSNCHSVTRGASGDGSWLGSRGFQEAYSDAMIGATVKFGRSGTVMIPYGKEVGGDLTDAEISDMVSFVRTLKGD